MSLKKTILIIDDELPIRRFLRVTFASHGYEPLEAENGGSGLALAASHQPDAVILDLGLPDGDGLLFLQQLREWYTGPILIVSARDDEASIVAGLDRGASDYMCKPFGTGELLARLRAAERNNREQPLNSSFLCPAFSVDFSARIVTRAGVEVRLTATEYDLLVFFVRNAGKVLTHRQILTAVWGPNAGPRSEYLRVYVGHLRQKLEDDPKQPRSFVTELGVGYRFKDE